MGTQFDKTTESYCAFLVNVRSSYKCTPFQSVMKTFRFSNFPLHSEAEPRGILQIK